jgi:hypothetical protein
MPMRLPSSLAAQRLAQVVDGPAAHVAVDLDHRAQQRRVRAMHQRHVLQRLDILGEATAAVAQPGVEERGADALVEAHAHGHFFHVGAQLLADHGDLVDEADLGGQEGVAGVLDHLGGAQVGHDDAGAQGQVQLRHLSAASRSRLPMTTRSGS